MDTCSGVLHPPSPRPRFRPAILCTRAAGLALLSASAAARAAGDGAAAGLSPTAGFVGWLIALGLGFAVGWFLHRQLAPRTAPGGPPAAGSASQAPLEHLESPALLYGPDGEWRAANAAARQFFAERSLTAAEAAPAQFAEQLRTCRETRAVLPGLESNVGTLWLGWTLEPQPDGCVRAHLSDLTEAKGREVALSRERDAALNTARMTSDFVATLSHDIRVPMNGVLGMANLLLEAGLNPQQREMARSVIQSAENVITLTDELLDLAKIEAGKLEINPQPVELSLLLDELLRGLAATAAEKHLDLACDCEPAIPSLVQADPVRLRQILANLLSNALKFTDRGDVFVRAWLDARPDGAGRELRFAVRDTGIGIPQEKRDRLFQAFSQADASTYGLYGGTGLGLVTSRRIAELMGGRLWFESEPGRGSTFFLAIPFNPVEGAAAPGWTHRQPGLEGRDILLVEDNPRAAALAARWISYWGARLLTYGTSTEVTAWMDSGGRCAVALVDLDLPEGSAPALLRRLSQLQPPPRTIAIAARPPDEGVALHGAEVLLKPLTPDALVECLRRAPRVASPKAAAPAAAPAQAPAAPKAAAAGPRARVVVADDDVVNQKVMRTFLERLGCEVRLAANGVETLALVAAAPCDILFLDIMMPRMDGLQTVREIRRLENERKLADQPTRHLPVVAITAKVMPGDRENGLAAGFDDYATKPINDARLREALQKYVPHFQPPGPLSAGTTMLAAPQLALVDRERLNELGSGDLETMREIVALFFQRMEALLPDIETTLAAGDLIEARRHAHTGAGSCATCGVMQGQNVMRRLERSIEAGQVDHSRALLVETRKVLAAARESLSDLLPPSR